MYTTLYYYLTPSEYNEFVEKANKLITNSYSKKKKLTRIDFDYLTKIVESLNEIYNNRLNQETINQEKLNQEKLNRERIIEAYKQHLKHEQINWDEINWDELEGVASHEVSQGIASHEVNHEVSQENNTASQTTQEDSVALHEVNEINLPPLTLLKTNSLKFI